MNSIQRFYSENSFHFLFYENGAPSVKRICLQQHLDKRSLTYKMDLFLYKRYRQEAIMKLREWMWELEDFEQVKRRIEADFARLPELEERVKELE